MIHLPPPFPSPPHGEGRSSTCPTDLNMETLSNPGSPYAGYDVGRKHDLSVLVVLERLNEGYRWRGAVELRQSPFDEQFEKCRAGDSPAITMSCRLRMMFVAIRMGKAGPSTCPTPLLARFGRHRSGLYRPRGHLPSQSNLGLAATTDQGNARPDLLNPALQSRITLFS